MNTAQQIKHRPNKEEVGGEVNHRPLLLILVAAILVWFSPHPVGISDDAWHLFVIFVSTIFGIMFRPMPVSSVVFVGMTATLLTGTLGYDELLSAYSKDSVWLIVMSFFLARGLVKTGLAIRISYYFVRLLGRHTLGLAYGIGVSEVCLATIIPSLVARTGGVIYPIVLATTENIKKDHPGMVVDKTCGFLMMSAFQISGISSAMFLTAMAANPLIVGIAQEMGIQISWGLWATAAIVPGLVSLILVPLILYKVMNIEIKQTLKAAALADEKLKEMGKLSKNEKIMFGTFFIVLSLWIFGGHIGIESLTAAMLGVSILLITGVLQWNDCIKEETAWATLFWLGGLIAMGSALKSLGLFDWLSAIMVNLADDLDWKWGLLALVLFYFYSHYLFASNTAHVTAMFSAFLATAIQIGSPALLSALLLGYCSNLFGGLTHYSSGPAPIFYASHYLTLQRWWYYGLISSVINIFVWIVIGGLWWKVLGLW
jgi:DASS family divalent anion:Na+ symporter